MSARAKGVAFEREVAKQFEAAGFTVRGLEAGGDLWAIRDGVLEHIECKRAERMKLPEWLRQLRRDAAGERCVLVFKQSRQPAYAVVPLDQYLSAVRDD